MPSSKDNVSVQAEGAPAEAGGPSTASSEKSILKAEEPNEAAASGPQSQLPLQRADAETAAPEQQVARPAVRSFPCVQEAASPPSEEGTSCAESEQSCSQYGGRPKCSRSPSFSDSTGALLDAQSGRPHPGPSSRSWSTQSPPSNIIIPTPNKNPSAGSNADEQGELQEGFKGPKASQAGNLSPQSASSVFKVSIEASQSPGSVSSGSPANLQLLKRGGSVQSNFGSSSRKPSTFQESQTSAGRSPRSFTLDESSDQKGVRDDYVASFDSVSELGGVSRQRRALTATSPCGGNDGSRISGSTSPYSVSSSGAIPSTIFS